MKSNQGIAIISIYSHIEAYPPSLNAIFHLAVKFDKVYILHRNVLPARWNYPENVHVIAHGEFVHADRVKELPFLKKIKSYASFSLQLRKLVSKYEPSLLLTYDGIAFVLANLFIPVRQLKTIVFWYHNHDVMIQHELPRTSLMWWIRWLELKYFHLADYFTLPTQARLVHFPVERLKNIPIVLPNFPSVNFYGKWKTNGKIEETIRIIFQGQISSSNAIAELIKLLPFRVKGKKIEIHLVGPISESYQKTLQSLSTELKVKNQVFFYGRLPYPELPSVTALCNIGVAYYGEHNVMVKTMSTASNKLFEYASVGLPVIINARLDMQSEFNTYSWIKFVEFETQQLLDVIEEIVNNYALYSQKARKDFETSLNFETAFVPFINSISLKK
jgi:glycosyltransferase involved in cell wall biosynthesis